MKNRIGRSSRLRLLMLTMSLAFLALPGVRVSAQQADTSPANGDEAEIRKIGVQYVEAFNKKDAKAVASFWSPEAIYTNRLTGEQVVGRKAIGEQFEQLFQGDAEIKIEVDVESIEFLTPNVAIETGVATVVSEQPNTTPYTAVYIRREGKWLLDRVTDDPTPTVISNYENLKPLEWMIGSWRDAGGGVSIDTTCNWTKNQNFITRSFSVSIEGEIQLSGLQIIGWDAGDKEIRSWTFDSDGGFSQARWSNEGDDWYVIKKGKTSGGEPVAAVNVISVVDDNSFKMRTVQRSIGGEMLPNIGEVVVVRQ